MRMYVRVIWGLCVLYVNVGRLYCRRELIIFFFNFFTLHKAPLFLCLYIIAKNPVPICGTLST